MDNDDSPVGYVLTRREALTLMGAGGFALLTGCGRKGLAASDTAGAQTAAATTRSGTCVARPQQTEGPYFVDERLNRSDIRSDPSAGNVKPGALLALTFNVSTLASNTCAPLPGAVVDVWHCDQLGVYSDVTDPGFDSRGQRFLRGYQTTDANGIAKFVTIYPGWYSGRTVHIHFKIRSAPSSRPGFEFTSQLYFDDALTDQVHSRPPYSAKGLRDIRNRGDGIFRRGGDQLTLAVASTPQGYAGTFNIALQAV